MSYFTIVPGAKWLISTTWRGAIHVFGHTGLIHPRNMEFIELGFVWSDHVE